MNESNLDTGIKMFSEVPISYEDDDHCIKVAQSSDNITNSQSNLPEWSKVTVNATRESAQPRPSTMLTGIAYIVDENGLYESNDRGRSQRVTKLSQITRDMISSNPSWMSDNQCRKQVYHDPAARLSRRDIQEIRFSGLPIYDEHNSTKQLGKILHGSIEPGNNAVNITAEIEDPELIFSIKGSRQLPNQSFSIGYVVNVDNWTNGQVNGFKVNEVSIVNQPFFDNCHINVFASKEIPKQEQLHPEGMNITAGLKSNDTKVDEKTIQNRSNDESDKPNIKKNNIDSEKRTNNITSESPTLTDTSIEQVDSVKINNTQEINHPSSTLTTPIMSTGTSETTTTPNTSQNEEKQSSQSTNLQNATSSTDSMSRQQQSSAERKTKADLAEEVRLLREERLLLREERDRLKTDAQNNEPIVRDFKEKQKQEIDTLLSDMSFENENQKTRWADLLSSMTSEDELRSMIDDLRRNIPSKNPEAHLNQEQQNNMDINEVNQDMEEEELEVEEPPRMAERPVQFNQPSIQSNSNSNSLNNGRLNAGKIIDRAVQNAKRTHQSSDNEQQSFGNKQARRSDSSPQSTPSYSNFNPSMPGTQVAVTASVAHCLRGLYNGRPDHMNGLPVMETSPGEMLSIQASQSAQYIDTSLRVAGFVPENETEIVQASDVRYIVNFGRSYAAQLPSNSTTLTISASNTPSSVNGMLTQREQDAVKGFNETSWAKSCGFTNEESQVMALTCRSGGTFGGPIFNNSKEMFAKTTTPVISMRVVD